MRLLPIPGKNLQEALLSIQNRIKIEQAMLLSKESYTLHLVLINRVAVQLAQLGIGAHHQAVVAAHSFHGSHAGQHGLASTTKAAKEVINNRTGHND